MKLALVTWFLFVLFYGKAQDQNVQVSGAIGWSAQNEWDEESKMRRKINRGYVVTAIFSSFLGSSAQITNPEIRISKNTTPPKGGRFEVKKSKFVGIGLDVCYTDITMYVEVVDYKGRYNFKYSHKRLSITPIVSLHPFYAMPYNTDLDPYIAFGLGYRKGSKIYTTNTKYGLSSEEEKSFPLTLKLSTGLVYYPIKPIGIRVEAGLGLSNLAVGVVFRLG